MDTVDPEGKRQLLIRREPTDLELQAVLEEVEGPQETGILRPQRDHTLTGLLDRMAGEGNDLLLACHLDRRLVAGVVDRASLPLLPLERVEGDGDRVIVRPEPDGVEGDVAEQLLLGDFREDGFAERCSEVNSDDMGFRTCGHRRSCEQPASLPPPLAGNLPIDLPIPVINQAGIVEIDLVDAILDQLDEPRFCIVGDVLETGELVFLLEVCLTLMFCLLLLSPFQAFAVLGFPAVFHVGLPIVSS
jgi:hypothetical protein